MEQRYVLYRPELQSGWRVQLEELKGNNWQVARDKDGNPKEVIDYGEDTSFAEVHAAALSIHPGMEVFVPQGLYTEGLTPDEDVAAINASGKAKEEQ